MSMITDMNTEVTKNITRKPIVRTSVLVDTSVLYATRYVSRSGKHNKCEVWHDFCEG